MLTHPRRCAADRAYLSGAATSLDGMDGSALLARGMLRRAYLKSKLNPPIFAKRRRRAAHYSGSVRPDTRSAASSSWSGTRQVLFSITKHAMRRSADEIGATSISFRPKVFSDPASVVD
jgi:hypothetical protein